MTTSLHALHVTATTLAGPDFMWTHPDAPKSKRSDELTGMLALLADAQNGICAACGDELDGTIQLCHVVASRKNGFGIMAGNVYAGHQTCNSDDYAAFGDIVPIASFERSDLIPTSLPTRSACLARRESDRVTRSARLGRRMALVQM